jgi:Uma2 family endonuclease
MVALITDPSLEQRLIAERQACGGDRFDEVWEGIYVTSPLPNVEHQRIVARLVSVLMEVIGWPGLGDVFAGANASDHAEGWEHDYRCPDVVVLLPGSGAEKCEAHVRGPADFLVEVISPGDRTREKLPFYSRLGVRELLVIDRQPWALELYRLEGSELRQAGRSTCEGGEILASQVVPLTFQLLPGQPRPQIRVVDTGSSRCWLV